MIPSWVIPFFVICLFSLVLTFYIREHHKKAKKVTLWSVGCLLIYGLCIQWTELEFPNSHNNAWPLDVTCLSILNTINAVLLAFIFIHPIQKLYPIFIVIFGFLLSLLSKNWLFFFMANECLFFTGLLLLGSSPVLLQRCRGLLLIHVLGSFCLFSSIGIMSSSFGTFSVLPYDLSRQVTQACQVLFLLGLLIHIPLWPFSIFWKEIWKQSSILGKLFIAMGFSTMALCGRIHYEILSISIKHFFFFWAAANFLYGLYTSFYKKEDPFFPMLFLTAAAFLFSFSLPVLPLQVFLAYALLWLAILSPLSLQRKSIFQIGIILIQVACSVVMPYSMPAAIGFFIWFSMYRRALWIKQPQ